MKNDKDMDNIGFYIMSKVQDFERCLRTEINLVEDDIRLVLEDFNSSLITYELEARILNFKDLSEVRFGILQPECELFNNSTDTEFHDITMKTKLVVRPVLQL